MASADAQWIKAYYTRDGELSSVAITVHAYGMSYAGVIEQFIYKVTPDTQAEYERTEDELAVTEREPMTEPPHHWYWWKIDR